MAYEPTNWENREVEKPRTYTMVNNPDGTITLQPAEGTVFVEGTPIVADNMNNIENQLVVAENHINNMVNPHNVTAEQVDTYTKSQADARYLIDAYTKSQSDARYQLELASREGAQLYQRDTRSYTQDGWRDIYFDRFMNDTSGVSSLGGYGVNVDIAGYYIITFAISLGNLSETSGYVLAKLVAGGDNWRMDARHFQEAGNISLNGSIVDYIPANTDIKLHVYCTADFDVVTNATGEVRGYMCLRQLL